MSVMDLLKDDHGFADRRAAMVADQIARRGVRDPAVLAALASVPRHQFVPDDQRESAYADKALPIGLGQTISQPYMVAAMTEALHITSTSKVLEVGTGSGYQAAVLASIAREVISIERRPELADAARRRLEDLGFVNVRIVIGDGTEGLAAEAPYDGILVAAGAPAVPEPLRAQLADGGHLVIPVGPAELQELIIVRRAGDAFSVSHGDPCVFVPLVGRHGWKDSLSGI